MNVRARVLLPTIVASALLCLQGCGGDKEEAKAPENPPSEVSSPPPATPPATTSPTTEAPTTTPAATVAKAPAITDGDILAIAQTAHVGEIDEAKVVESKTKNAKVKSYAKMMQKHHGDARDQGDKLAKKLSISPTDNTTTTDMKVKATEEITTLQGKTGTDLDRAYLDHQVKEHEEVLTTIDTKLLPNAQSPEVKQLLTDLRPTIVKHLEEAKKLQAGLPAK